MIDVFGARVDETLYAFEVEPLPEETVSARIELGEVERNVFEAIKWNKLKNA